MFEQSEQIDHSAPFDQDESTEARFTPPTGPTVAACLAAARAEVADERFVAQSHCVDVLLDCLNAAARPVVRTFITEALAEIAHVRLVTAQAFIASLDEIQMALQVDAAFDHLELPLA